MKRLAIILAVAGLVSMPALALAGIDGSDHDRGGQICQNCHIPHNAQGTKLWFEAPAGAGMSTIQQLCYSCHDGSITSVGLTSAFDVTKEQHVGITANGSAGDCDGCHDVHNQNPVLSGKFLYADIVESANGEYCSTCHDGSAPAEYSDADIWLDHTYGTAGTTNHYNSASFTCVQCHTPHGATAQTTNPGALTAPILLADNQPGAFYGAFCISCHSGTAPAVAVTGSGGVAAADQHDYTQGTTGGNMHPSTTVTAGGCDLCHDVHAPATAGNIDHLLLEDNVDGAYCTSCHTGGGGPTIGTSHPYGVTPDSVGMNTGLTPALPWSDEINDDPGDLIFTGVDYSSPTADLITCETCHSVHRLGADAPLLREANDTNQLCGSCHPANY